MVSSFVSAAGASRGDRVSAAIWRASASTGVEFRYLFNQARLESGLDPAARARTSSATGLFQFVSQTWLATVSKHGADHGLGWAADAISRDSSGRYRVADPAARAAILDLRNDPEAASAMAAELAADNRAVLERTLGREARPVDLYLAHFLGAAGATAFLRANDADPDAPAAALLPQAARANRSVFFDKDGRPRSLDEIRERFAAKLGGAGSSPGLPEVAPDASWRPMQGGFVPLRMASLQSGTVAPELVRPSPQYARLAYLMLAEIGG